MGKYSYIPVLVFLIWTDSLNAQLFQERVTTAANLRLTTTNIGTFGNAFRGYRDGTGQQSCEFPAGSGIEHLFEGGLWVGGINRSDGTIQVSTSAFDAPQGYAAGRAGFEFTVPIGAQTQERSSLTDSRFFNTSAVSHQDFISTFNDVSQVVPGTSIPIQNHQFPMNIEVTQEIYNWNFSFSDFFVVVNFKLKNIGQNTYDDLHVALWNNAVVRNVNITPAGSGGAAFYSQGGNGYMDSLVMAYCFDATGDVGFTESYIGQKFLGSEDKFGFHHPLLDSTFNKITNQWEPDDFKAHYNAWQFNNATNPIFNFPTSDQIRYDKMTQGLNYSPCWNNPNGTQCQQSLGADLQALLNASGNRSDIVSVGPFNDFAPGDEIEVTFAYIMARKVDDGNPNSANTLAQRENLIANANWVQTAYNGNDVNFNGVLDEDEDDGTGKINRWKLPAPPDIPQTRVEAGENRIDIYWTDNSLFSVDPISLEEDFEGFRIYSTKPGFDVTKVPNLQEDLILIAEFDLPSNQIANDVGLGPIELPVPVKFEGDAREYVYKYSIENVLNGWQYAVAVTAFDRGNPEINLAPLESSILANQFRVFPGTRANEDMKEDKPFVYPNPYYYGAAWEGRSNFQEESRKLIFANLPRRCKISIFTPSGDLIDIIEHDENYDGRDTRWFRTFGSEDPDRNRFSGGEHAWDLLSKDTQIIARGLYLFSVEDLETGKRSSGTFAIIK